jgi:hypothetical protein
MPLNLKTGNDFACIHFQCMEDVEASPEYPVELTFRYENVPSEWGQEPDNSPLIRQINPWSPLPTSTSD